MTILIIPTTTDPAQIFTLDLDDVRCVFDIQYNDRSEIYTLTLTNDTTGQIYFEGEPLVLGTDILEPYNYNLGIMGMVDMTNKGVEANPDNFGITTLLIWVSTDELTEAV